MKSGRRYNPIWNEMTNFIKRVMEEVLEIKKEGKSFKETWLWNEEVQTAIGVKRTCYKAW